MENWNPVAFKALLRTTSQRLGQLQERIDSNGQLTRRDISAYLAQGNLAVARVKAGKLIQDDVIGDLLEELEMLVGTVGGQVGELDNVRAGKPLSPILMEAAASIIHAAPSTESKDLNLVREILVQRLGPVFAQAASASRNSYVSPRIMQILSSPAPSASKMDDYLLDIAHTFGVKWAPEPRRQDLQAVVAEILRVEPSLPPVVDIPRLREICVHGLPDDPPWIRPRVWRLMFGTLPVLKTTWARESQKQRDSYYDLVRRLLAPLDSLPPPSDTPSPTDAVISRISESLSRVSPDLFVLLESEPKGFGSGSSPLDPAAPENIRIDCSFHLDRRLELLKTESDTLHHTPEIRLETEVHHGSDTALSSPPPATSDIASRRHRKPTTLLPSKSPFTPPAHPAHLSALRRLLYLHHTLNPAVRSPNNPWLLVPLYSALVGEVDENEVAHVEADTFWVFEALLGEIAEMEDEEGVKVWMGKFSERLRWVDGDLAASLHSTGLDPALPHYSYLWLAPVLAQSLPLSSVLPVWDVIFACPMRTRDSNPKLEYLVDICTALLVRARTPLFRLGKPARNAPGLWSQEHATLPPPSPLRPWELSDAFTEGLSLLTSYPIDAAGGIDRVLQTAHDLAQRRIEARNKKEKEAVGFGTRIKDSIWKGFTNQVTDGDLEDEEELDDESDDEVEEHDDGNETETPAAPTLTSRLANTVWRGITNQSSMEDEVPSPSSASPSPQPSSRDAKEPLPDPDPAVPSTQKSLWSYAGKLKDSDTIAAFSKVSTNWRAKAMDAWSVRNGGSNASAGSTSGVPVPSSSATDNPPRKSGWPTWGSTDLRDPNQRRGSLPMTDRESIILDPPRPAFFRSPRESFLPQPRRQDSTAQPEMSPSPRDANDDSSSFIHKTKSSLVSLAAFQSSSQKTVPRPLMLNSHNLITSRSHSSAHSEGSTPPPRNGQWRDVLLAKGHVLRQESVSSTSSLSPSEAVHRGYSSARSLGAGPRSDNDSDGGSRRVPLNRRAISPMALASRSPNLPWNMSPPGMSPVGHPLSSSSTASSDRGWKSFEEPPTTITTSTTLDSPTTISSPPIPSTPLLPPSSGLGNVRIVNGRDGGHVGTESISTTSEASTPLEPPTQNRMITRKKTPPLPPSPKKVGEEAETSEDSSISRTPSARAHVRVRAKRFASRPANLRIRENGVRAATMTANTNTDLTSSPGSERLAPEWPGDHDNTTPKVENFASEAVGTARPSLLRKLSKETEGARSKRILGDGSVRVRKVSTSSREVRRTRESDAEEGDDEGYGDLLSAYESEEGSRER